MTVADRNLRRLAEKYVGAICLYGHGPELEMHALSLRQAAVTYAEAVRESEKKTRRPRRVG